MSDRVDLQMLTQMSKSERRASLEDQCGLSTKDADILVASDMIFVELLEVLETAGQCLTFYGEKLTGATTKSRNGQASSAEVISGLAALIDGIRGAREKMDSNEEMTTSNAQRSGESQTIWQWAGQQLRRGGD